MRMVLGLSVVLAACVADVAGTHQSQQNGEGSGSQTTDDESTATPMGYLKRIASIHCTQAFMCRDSFPPDLGYTFEAQWTNSEPECEAMLLDAWNTETLESEIAKGRAVYDGSAAASCLEGVTFGACPDYWMRGIEWADACYSVIIGKVPTGGSCQSLYSCESFSCDEPTQTCL
ncbi:MAG: hypothetical protein HOV81_32675 [Kofleriaceae bacterium]|nr:hypothetical protein [Kofleriaceae bacterium]